MIPDQYVWFVWSSAFSAPWLVAYAAFPRQRKAMVWASLLTTPFGLTEPLFVPAYWSPPSPFDLARTTGFDIESLIFTQRVYARAQTPRLANIFSDPLPKRDLSFAFRFCIRRLAFNTRRPCFPKT
jgi:hypothetical protein